MCSPVISYMLVFFVATDADDTLSSSSVKE